MKIGIDISQSAHKGTGVARFTTGLTHAILEHSSSIDWSFFYSSLRRELDPHLYLAIKDKGFDIRTSRIPPTALELMWNRLHLIGIERFMGDLDWFITSDWTEPPAKAKKATIVHDLVYLKMPETVISSISDVQKRRLKLVKKESDIIFADSIATKEDLVQLLDIDEKKVVLNYPGVSMVKPTIEVITRTQFKFQLHKPFILAVGKIEPRKNLKRLIEAFSAMNYPDVELVIAGPDGWDDLEKRHDRVMFLGYVSDVELASLYSLAQVFVFPSLYEGFGYPAIEAMSMGCPVVMSRTSSLIELGEGVSEFFDPLNIENMAASIKKVLQSDSLRRSMADKGKTKSTEYTWGRYYKTLMKALR